MAIVKINPPGAVEWTAMIQNPIFRQTLMRRVASQWLQANPKAAQSWIRQSPLPEKIKRELLKKNP